MLVDTPEKMERRWSQIQNAKAEALYEKYKKTRDKTLVWALQKFYGWDGDYMPGIDDGETLEANENEND